MRSRTSSFLTTGSSPPILPGLKVGERHAVELLQLGSLADLVVALDDVSVVAVMGRDLRKADPAGFSVFSSG
jgi:hypothetical protein